MWPPELHHSLFTTSAAANFDHTSSSTTAHDSFHGTGISLMHHLEYQGQAAAPSVVIGVGASTSPPHCYTDVIPHAMNLSLPSNSQTFSRRFPTETELEK